MYYLGIDPGVQGGIAVVASSGRVKMAEKMPATEADVWEMIRSWKDDCYAVIEQVGVRPGEGAVGAFTFGRGYGALRMALIAAEIRFEEVRPQVWQKYFGLITGKDLTKTQKKNRSKSKAKNLFPKVKMTHAIAEALLIADFARFRLGSQRVGNRRTTA